MQAGNLTYAEVREFTSRVLVNGRVWETVSWSIDRELTGDLPKQVTAVSGVTQATANIEWAMPEEIADPGVNPWVNPDLFPARGARVEIYVSDGETEWKQFHGRIDNTTGSIGGGYSSTCIDDYDRLSIPIAHPPLLRSMPPSSGGGEMRGVGLTSTYYVDTALRNAGFYATPANMHRCVLHVPCQGSMWPYQAHTSFGTMTNGGSYDGQRFHNRNFSAPWGWAASNFICAYEPRQSYNRSTPLQMQFLRAPNHAGEFTFDVWYGAERVRLAAWGSGDVNAYIGTQQVLRIPAAELDGATIFTLLVKSGRWTLRANNGAEATGTATVPSTEAMRVIEISGRDDARIAGIQVGHPEQSHHEFPGQSFEPTAHINVGPQDAFVGVIDAARAIDQVPAHQLIKEIGDATLSAVWIDETGVVQYTPSMVLNSQNPVRTVTTLDDVAQLRWEDNLLGTRSRIVVKYLEPAIITRRNSSLTVYEGSKRRLTSGEEQIDFVGPGSDEDWIMPDGTINQLGVEGWSPFNNGTFTQGGFYYTNDHGEIDGTGFNSTVEMETVGLSRYKLTHRAGYLPFSVTAHTATSPTASTLWPHNRDLPLPVIRAYGRVLWAEENLTPVAAGGAGPELVHDAGFWNSNTYDDSELVAIANYLASQTSMPRPVIKGMQVLPDPRLQLGDVIRVFSELMQATLNTLITRVTTSFDNDGLSMTLQVRVTRLARHSSTYRDFNNAGSEATYQQWNAATGDQTYSQLSIE